jgi:CheY-like chemotaxis protein
VAKTVLIAGARTPTRQALSFILANRGYEVIEVSDGRTAIEQVQSAQPDLAILEAELPEESGYHVYRRMKEDPTTRAIPVLLLVADTEAFSMPTRTVPPAQNLISKPFTAHDLLLRVGRLMP